MKLRFPSSAKFFIGTIFGERERLDEALRIAEREIGQIEASSDEFSFDFTDYYEREMGPALKRVFVFFSQPLPMDRLVEIKLLTLQMEEDLSMAEGARSVNLDPGYLSPSNLVLATTKGYSHRIYLGEGIYGDVQLIFKRSAVEVLPWTYPDYRSPQYQQLFLEIRRRYLRNLRAGPAES